MRAGIRSTSAIVAASAALAAGAPGADAAFDFVPSISPSVRGADLYVMGWGMVGHDEANLSIADADRDGKPDAVVAGAAVAVHLSSGRRATVEQNARDAVVFDFGRDPIPDMVTIDSANGFHLRYYEGTEGGGYKSLASQGGYGEVADLDVAVAPRTGVPALAVAAQDGVFFGFPHKSRAYDGSARAVRIGDVNGDDLLDVVSLDTGGGWVRVAYGTGDQTLGAPTAYEVTGPATELVLADLNRDGLDDIVTQSATTITIRVTGKTIVTLPKPTTATAYRGLAAGDINSDGWDDLVYTLDGVMWARVNTRSSATAALSTVGPLARLGWPVKLATADFDADGRVDVAAARDDVGTLTILHNRSTGNASPTPLSVSFPNTPIGARSLSTQITYTNTGQAPMEIKAVKIGGPDADQFDLISTDCTDRPLNVLATCSSWVRYTPRMNNTGAARLRLISADGTAGTVSLGGTATAAAAQPAAAGTAPATAARAEMRCRRLDCSIRVRGGAPRAVSRVVVRRGRRAILRLAGPSVDGQALFGFRATGAMRRSRYTVIVQSGSRTIARKVLN